jgi:uncharacterized protein (TIGR03032 family)
VPASNGDPVVIVGPPASGAPVLGSALARAAGVWHLRDAGDVIERALPALGPAARGWVSHALAADDAAGNRDAIRGAVADALVDREGRPAARGSAGTAILWGAPLALRVPFLDAIFPEARFVLCARDPAEAAEEMLRSWRSGQFVSLEELPGWPPGAWSLPLIDGWRELVDRPLEEVVVAQWSAIAERALTDLESLAPERWAIVEFSGLIGDPQAELRRVCRFARIDYDQALLSPVEEIGRRLAGGRPDAPTALSAALGRARAVQDRIRQLLASPGEGLDAGANRDAPVRASPFRSSYTAAFKHALDSLRASLLISTYQSGRLICARSDGAVLNTHLRQFEKPMGVAATGRRFALGTRTEIWDFRDAPELAAKLEPAGRHDACFLPRNRHLTGDILIHELAFDADGRLWGVATAFSCLATFDAATSFVPQWKPEFITALGPGDRCHLNGLCMRDGRPYYVTALGRSNTPGGWRAGKATGGLLIDIATGAVIADGLSMPHSPRWHEDRLYVLESGRGELVAVDPATGTTETIAELPGFTRGLAIAGELAFVGLSQIRESSTFGDLPIISRLQERACGVWAVNLVTGETAGVLRFEDLVQEIFEIALLPGIRYPEIAEPDSTAATTTFVLGPRQDFVLGPRQD